jgi:hypothetical protein
LADLPWLSGAWFGQVGQDLVEEHWSDPAAGTLMGMFRSMRDETGHETEDEFRYSRQRAGR